MTKVEKVENYGLEDDWSKILTVLEEIIPVYDKTNRYISLGTDLSVRKEGVELLSKITGNKDSTVIDIGSGPGKMAELLSKTGMKNSRPLLFDALYSMMKVARKRKNNCQDDGIVGVYEALPIRNECFDSAMASFSLRDAKDLKKALQEIRRILSMEGLFLIVDLTKPDSAVKRFLIATYWRVVAPAIALCAVGSRGLKFASLYTTFQRLPRISTFLDLVRSIGFDVVELRARMLGGVGILLLRKRGEVGKSS